MALLSRPWSRSRSTGWHDPPATFFQPSFTPVSGSERFFDDFFENARRDWENLRSRSQMEMDDWANKNSIPMIKQDYHRSNMEVSPTPRGDIIPVNNYSSSRSSQFVRTPSPSLAITGTGNLGNLGEVRADHNGFNLSVDVGQFRPEELKVSTIGNELVVEGKHQEHGASPTGRNASQHQFKHKYTLPENVDPADVKGRLSSMGFLSVSAPSKRIEYDYNRSRSVPISSPIPYRAPQSRIKW